MDDQSEKKGGEVIEVQFGQPSAADLRKEHNRRVQDEASLADDARLDAMKAALEKAVTETPMNEVQVLGTTEVVSNVDLVDSFRDRLKALLFRVFGFKSEEQPSLLGKDKPTKGSDWRNN